MNASLTDNQSGVESTSRLKQNAPTILWIVVTILGIIVTLMAAPEAYRQAVDLTDMSASERVAFSHQLSQLHLTSKDVAAFEFFIQTLTIAVKLMIGWLLIRKSSRDWFVVYLAFVIMAGSFGTYPPAISEVLPGQPTAQNIVRLLTLLGMGGFLSLPFVFPSGRFVPRWTFVLAGYVYYGVLAFLFDGLYNPLANLSPITEAATSLTFVGCVVASVVYRYRFVATPLEREQTRLVAFGLLIGIPGFYFGDMSMRHIGASPVGIACLFSFLILMPITTTAPVAAVGIAMLQKHLFDVDIVLNRTLVWLVMTAAVTGTYVGIVLGFGSLISFENNLVLSLLATGIVAVGFQSVKDRVQRFFNRLLFGDRDDPYRVLSQLAQQIETTVNANELLPQIVQSTANALRLPYVALLLDRASGPELVAFSGSSIGTNLQLPLTYQGQSVGTLVVSPRSPGEVFSSTDQRLLEDLARQVGVAVHTVSLAEELQQSREQIILSREEDRRRLRRELHDGLGAQLAALIMQAGAARSLIYSDPDAADNQLAELRAELRSAIADIRRLALGLRPPALDELGLVGALDARLSHIDRSGLDDDALPLLITFDTEGDLSRLGAAAEVAAYRIVEEAITNIVKHANATEAIVRLQSDGDRLSISIVDNGSGIDVSQPSDGLGLHSMKERARELGGSCTITPGPVGGATVYVEFPAQTDAKTEG